MTVIYDLPHVMTGLGEALIPANLTGQTVLDAGGGDGRWAAECLKRCAKSVTVVDNEQWREYPEEKSIPTRPDIKYHRMDIMAWHRQADLVLCFNVLYHSKEPWRLLEHLRALTLGRCILIGWIVSGDLEAWLPRRPREDHPTDPTVYWLATVPGLMKLCRIVGFEIQECMVEGNRCGLRMTP